MMEYSIINPIEDGVLMEAFEDMLPENYMDGAKEEFFIGAVNPDNEAVGILGFVNEPDRYKISFLYTVAEERRRGVATLLVDTLIDFIDSIEEYKDIEADFLDAAKDVKGFFDNNTHFIVHREYKSFKVTPREIHNSNKLKMIMGKSYINDIGLFELKNTTIHRIVDYLGEEAGYIINDYNYWEQCCEKELCRCIKGDNGEVDSLVLVERKGAQDLVLSYLLADNPIKAMSLIKSVAERFMKDYDDCDMEITVVNESGFKLMEGIFPLVGHESSCYKACWNYF